MTKVNDLRIVLHVHMQLTATSLQISFEEFCVEWVGHITLQLLTHLLKQILHHYGFCLMLDLMEVNLAPGTWLLPGLLPWWHHQPGKKLPFHDSINSVYCAMCTNTVWKWWCCSMLLVKLLYIRWDWPQHTWSHRYSCPPQLKFSFIN